MEFKNSDETHKGLGIPLPKGPIRVFQAGRTASPNSSARTPSTTRPRTKRSTSAWAMPSISRPSARPSPTRATKDKEYLDQQIKLRNHKAEPVAVEVIEPINGRREAVDFRQQPPVHAAGCQYVGVHRHGAREWGDGHHVHGAVWEVTTPKSRVPTPHASGDTFPTPKGLQNKAQGRASRPWVMGMKTSSNPERVAETSGMPDLQPLQGWKIIFGDVTQGRESATLGCDIQPLRGRLNMRLNHGDQMKRSFILTIAYMTAALTGSASMPQPPKQQPKDALKPGVHLTVYESFALVKDRRELPDELRKAPTSFSSAMWPPSSIRPVSTFAR